MVEGGHGEGGGKLLLGLVPWAPIDQPTATLERYLSLAEQRAGTETWSLVKGFRFLLQAIIDQATFERLVHSEHFLANLQLLGRRGLSFDIGVDQHSAGIWQLEAIAIAMERAHTGMFDNGKISFIINHLCKPDFSSHSPDFERWCKSISAMARCSRTYMKLSGGFSELPSGLSSTKDIAEHVKPWVKQIFESFGPSRVMFGSDWPVCNVNGPKGEDSWSAWKDVVELIMGDHSYGLTEADKERVWSGTAAEAYRLG